MAFATTGLTELGPYGVPVAITLPLFTDGVALRTVLAQGFYAIDCDLPGTVQLINEETGQYCFMLEGPAETLFNLTTEGMMALAEAERAEMPLTDEHSIGLTVTNLVTDLMAVVDFSTSVMDLGALEVSQIPQVVELEAIMNIVEVEDIN
jgi:hypothetical protein